MKPTFDEDSNLSSLQHENVKVADNLKPDIFRDMVNGNFSSEKSSSENVEPTMDEDSNISSVQPENRKKAADNSKPTDILCEMVDGLFSSNKSKSENLDTTLDENDSPQSLPWEEKKQQKKKLKQALSNFGVIAQVVVKKKTTK